MSTVARPDLNAALKHNFVLWIKFNDDKCRSMKAHSMVTTINQYLYYKGGTIKVDYYKGFSGLLKLVQVDYKDKYVEARIYRKHDNKLLVKWVRGKIVESEEFNPHVCAVYYSREQFDKENPIK